jgi:tetratricopeptide (TPR) repeat protein
MRDRIARCSLLVLLPIVFTSPAVALGEDHQDHAAHGVAHDVEGLGTVHFPVSCAAEVQPGFDRAVALLHSFGYEEARLAFQEVAQRDPSCAMARWGEAMTWYHPVWAPPTPAELAAGAAAAEAAAALPAKTERERAWVAAIGTFYRDSAKVDHRTRAQAYEEAMRQLMERSPDDTEATIFYAMLGTAPSPDGNLARQKRSAAILEPLLAAQPRHPGLVHYMIHAFDYPQTASLALGAARAYAGIAPESAHARHMPSHIFTRLGLWEEAAASNWSSVEAAQARAARLHPGTTPFDSLHAYDYLEYAYLQLGQDDKAAEVLALVSGTQHLDQWTFQAAHALAAVPARNALERRQWQAAATLTVPALGLDWTPFAYAQAIVPFANAVGAARSGDPAGARRAVERLSAIEAQLAAKPPAGSYDWAAQVESMRLAAAGWLARAERHDDEAVRLLGQAADLEERVGKHPVTPGAVLPAREQLGDLLLELGRPAEALAAYEAALAAAPNRFNGLAGAARAAEKAGRSERATELSAALRALCRPPACTRKEPLATVQAGATH